MVLSWGLQRLIIYTKIMGHSGNSLTYIMRESLHHIGTTHALYVKGNRRASPHLTCSQDYTESKYTGKLLWQILLLIKRGSSFLDIMPPPSGKGL